MVQSDYRGLLLDQTQDKVTVIEADGTFTYLNAATRRILGFDPEELLGENAFEYIHPEDVEGVRATFERTIHSDSFTEATEEYRFRDADGGWVWLESRMSNLSDPMLDGYVLSSRDVPARVRAERERAETASRLEELSAVSGDVLWMFDADWSELLFMNPAYEDIYGRPVEEIEADPEAFLETIHPEDVPAVKEGMKRLSAGNSVDMEYRVNPRQNYKYWVWVKGEPITKAGSVVRITGFTRDVTERKRRERQLIVMDNLLRHNLRNDLTNILGRVEIIEEAVPEVEAETAVIRNTAEDLLQTAEKQRDIIEMLTESGTETEIVLQNALSSALETVRERYPEATVEVRSPEDRLAVRGRPQLSVAVVELLENAIQHSTRASPTVTVRLERGVDCARLHVEDDTGPIPAFEAAVLEGDHEMTNIYHSSGLGLWLVYWCVELSNGTITVVSEDGRGNRITVSLPRSSE
jgi:PAS domain S-box-containing protein